MQVLNRIRDFFSSKPKVVNLYAYETIELDETLKNLRITAKHLASSLNETEVKQVKMLFESMLFMPIGSPTRDIPEILDEMNVSALKGAIRILLDLNTPYSDLTH